MERHFNLDKDGWNERKPVKLTKQDREVLKEQRASRRQSPQGQNEDNRSPSLIAVQNKIKQQSRVKPKKKDQDDMNSLYETLKPEIKEGDDYDLVGFDVSVKDGKPRGILNYRLNGEHKQKRF